MVQNIKNACFVLYDLDIKFICKVGKHVASVIVCGRIAQVDVIMGYTVIYLLIC